MENTQSNSGDKKRKHDPAWADNTQAERNKRKYNIRKERNKIITQLRQSNENEVVRLSTALPCAIRADTETGLCGKPAYAAYCDKYFDLFVPGRYLIQPVCEQCAKDAAAVYAEKS